jgi:pantoate--beta-alanine ligase
MQIIHKSAEIQTLINEAKSSGKKIGFVPTMGALHEGHISLVKLAAAENDLVVSSIFINPTQFNNSKDFEKYPVTIEQDVAQLKQNGCHMLFLPSVDEIYPTDYSKRTYDLGRLESILEGAARPGHFQGVCMVVERLLSLIPAQQLYLGEKDYQQCLVIQKLLQLSDIPVQLTICPTVREKDGLAMSSRNMRLTEKEREKSTVIFQTLNWLKENLQQFPIDHLIHNATTKLENAGFKVDYVALTDNDLNPVVSIKPETSLRGLIAAHMNEIRLIDNMLLS